LRRQLDAGLAELTEEWPKLEEALSPAERAGINICDGGTILRLDGERTIEAPLSSRDDLQVGMPIVVPTIAGYMRALVERDENGVLSWRAGEHTTGNLEFDADSRGCWITSESRIARSAKVLWVVWQHRRPRLEIGQAFTHPTTGDLWKVTDIGKRTVIAINVTATMAEHAGDESWLRGPPYAIAEHVWDEYSLGALLGAPDVEWEDIPTGTSIPKG
jgi:hypothetical protein